MNYFEFQDHCNKVGFWFLLGVVVLAFVWATIEQIVEAIKRRRK